MLSLIALLLISPAHAETTLEHNKRIVREFYDMAFNAHKPLDAAMKYLAESYKQHNPHVADGRKGFIDAFANQTDPDKSVTEFKRFIAEDDLVMIHSHGIDDPSDPKDRGVAVVDIFRVQGDLITEHWDVGQKVPETSANNNGMF
ncbi:MAG: nuclear transport factor 2 family protein [Bdellovibrionota bacterium]